MDRSWVPPSAAALVTGALALMLSSFLLPSGDGTAETLLLVREQDQRWFTVAILFNLSAVCLLLGLPCLLLLFPRRGHLTGMAAVAMMTVASAGTGGFGMLLVFFRALVLQDALRPGAFDTVTEDLGLGVMLLGWVASFYLGELLLAIAVLRARSVPRWVPVLLLLHVATLPLGGLLPDWLSTGAVLLTAVALSGLAIAANSAEEQLQDGRRLARRG